jgi:hypothetical protein
MKQKTLIILSSILVPLLLVGVGFSTYAITNAVTASGTGTLTAEDFKKDNKSIVVTLNSIAFVTDSANTTNGFLSDDHTTVSNDATLTANVTFTGFSGDSKDFNFILRDTTGKFVNNNVIKGTPACTCTTDPKKSVGSSVGDNTFGTNKLTNVITFTTLSSSFTATVTYPLTYSTEIVEDSSISLTVEEA